MVQRLEEQSVNSCTVLGFEILRLLGIKQGSVLVSLLKSGAVLVEKDVGDSEGKFVLKKRFDKAPGVEPSAPSQVRTV